MHRLSSKNFSAHRRSVNTRWRRACRGSVFGLLALFTFFIPYLLIGKTIVSLNSSYTSTVFFSPFAKSNIQRLALEKANQSLKKLGSKFPSKLVKKIEENEELIFKSSHRTTDEVQKSKDTLTKVNPLSNSSLTQVIFSENKFSKSQSDNSQNSETQNEQERESSLGSSENNGIIKETVSSNNVRAVMNGPVLKFNPLDVDGDDQFDKNSKKRKERREKRYIRQMKRLTYLTSQDLTYSDDVEKSTHSTLKDSVQDDLEEKIQTDSKNVDLTQFQEQSQDRDQEDDETKTQVQDQSDESSHEQFIEKTHQKTRQDQSFSFGSHSNQANQNQIHFQAQNENQNENPDLNRKKWDSANDETDLHTHEQAHPPPPKRKQTSFQKKRNSLLRKYNIWKSDKTSPRDNELLKLLRQQIIMAKGYMAIAQQYHDNGLYKELKHRMKENLKIIGEAVTDEELPSSAFEGLELMGLLLSKARKKDYDCTTMVKKLRSMVEGAEESNLALKKQSVFLSQLAAKSMPKSLTCFSLQLTIEYYQMPEEKRIFPRQENLVDRSLIHYALFSDNVLAAAVVVNSTMMNAKDTSNHVFHVVTDRLNYAAMKMWFFLNPPADATIEVLNYYDFKWLNSSYCPVLRQLESASMKEYYFKASSASGASSESTSSNLKYRNPKYLSMLNHIRFYLPQMFPDLERILFLDDDIVVQRDLTPLWDVDLNGMVNGAVETCGRSFHRYDKYLNFSHPLIAANFDPQACGWAFGMNLFDLKMWRERDMTGIYHKWQNANEDRTLWKLGTLPPGLITFYNQTFPLDKSWHFLGLGYNSNLDMNTLQKAAVIHWNGNLKPWLDIAITKFKPFWTKYVNLDDPVLKNCNFNA